MNYKLTDISKITQAKFLGEDSVCSSICYDSRTYSSAAQTLFVAFRGERIDGHSYIRELYNRGVRSFLVDSTFANLADLSKFAGAGFVVADSTLECLQTLAAYHRAQYSGKVVAIVGSNGKTIVKEMVAQLIDSSQRLFRSPQSYNSQIGVALSLLMINLDESLVLIEAGISEPCEMELLEKMVKPQIVLFTNIGDAHQQNFQSQEQKLSEKLKICKDCNTIIYRKGSEEAAFIEKNFASKELISHNPKEVVGSILNFKEGVYSENISSAVTLLSHLGMLAENVNDRVASLRSTPMRLELCRGVAGAEIINDSYNSDYGALCVAMDFLQTIAQSRPKVVILSDICQSGEDGAILYQKVATLMRDEQVSELIAVGPELVKYKNYFSVERKQFYLSTADYLMRNSERQFAGSVILLKGGRVFEFERIMHTLERKVHNTILEVSLDDMLSNLNFFRSKLKPQTKCMAMVKANSYGSGTVEVARALESASIDYLAVAFADEGVELREGGVKSPIVVLGSDPSGYGTMIEYNLEPEIYSLESLTNFSVECQRRGLQNYPIHIKLDTGMHRMGFEKGDIAALIELLKSRNSVKVSSIFSHLTSSDNADHNNHTLAQIALFTEMSDDIKSAFSHKINCHICNSAAIVNYPEAHFDMVRLGVGLYGFGFDELTPVSTLKTIVTQIREVDMSQTVGYNRNGKLKRNSKIATIAIGYADGVRRQLGNGNWSVVVGSKLAPIIGNVCMDSCMIDITDIDVSVGDYVTVFGEGATVEMMAEKLNTISYEVLTDISLRVKRTYVKS